MKTLAALLAAIAVLLGGDARGQSLTKGDLAGVDFEQRLGESLPLDAPFRDESGAPVRLGDYFGKRPVLLVLAYYNCPSLCTVTLNGLLDCVRNLRGDAGSDYEIVIVSIRPGETPAAATAKKQTYVARYGRPGASRGWHFLVGDAASIGRVAQAAGFHYRYEPASGQFAHPSGILVATPTGTISRYFLGIEYPSAAVHTALVQAGQNGIGGFAAKLLLLCFHYDPVTGRYRMQINLALRLAGMGTVLVLAWGIVWSLRRERALGQGAGP